jgi:hypothetical protein
VYIAIDWIYEYCIIYVIYFLKNLKSARSEEKVPLKESEKFDFEIFLVS